MAVKDIQKAALYTDRHLKRIGKSRIWVWLFWRDHVEDKRAEDTNLLGTKNFIDVVIDVQRFVFSDDGDVACGVATQPATTREMDGKLGPATSRRMETWVDWLEEAESPVPPPLSTSDDCILVGGTRLPVGGGVQIVSLDEEDGRWSLAKYSEPWGSRVPSMLGFGHWDVCTSAEKCMRALRAQRLSSGGVVDNPNADGKAVFFQGLDPKKRRGRHAGGTANRAAFFSFDLSNAVYTKYADGYEKKVGIRRPTLHMNRRDQLGRGTVFLGMYAAQIRTVLYVLKALAEYSGLRFEFPHHADGSARRANWKELWKSKWDGIATHHHLPGTSKWDVRGLELQIVVMFLKGELQLDDFPTLVESFRIHDTYWMKRLEEFERTCQWPELGIG